ncbi:MAG TPA: class I SAM-dependent methyltransferase [Patescibacteria group bacterium]|nr:class I SAM-dependent methyltransferase [Patescibacteria group bacterium]
MMEMYQYNEMIHPGVDFSSPDEVAVYDSYMQKMRNIPQEINRIRELVQLQPTDTLLDIGAGTGETAIGLAPHCSRVLAIDVSPAMLEYTLHKVQARGNIPISFSHAGFLTFDFPAESIDVVISQFALHHLPELWKLTALKRVASVLKPGGRFFLQDAVLPSRLIGDNENYLHDLVHQIEKNGGEKVAQDTAQTFRDEYVTFDWIQEELLRRAGLSIHHLDSSPPFVATYLCVKEADNSK